MIGTILNVIAVLVGGGLGTLFGERFPVRQRETVLSGLGLFIIALGVKMAVDSADSLITLASVLLGGLLGEWWRLEDRLTGLGTRLERRFGQSGTADGSARFIQGFVSSSLLICVGPMAILGSIQDGLTGDFSILAIKSVMDAFATLAFAASMGVGVMFSAVMVGLYQGGLTLLAGLAQQVLTESMIREMTAAGGVLIMGIGVGPILELRKIRLTNYVPALAIAPLIVAALHALGVVGF